MASEEGLCSKVIHYARGANVDKDKIRVRLELNRKLCTAYITNLLRALKSSRKLDCIKLAFKHTPVRLGLVSKYLFNLLHVFLCKLLCHLKTL